MIVTLGAGGVGKTTTSAALALGLAMRGAKVAVVTIDPARRLATALGLERALGRAASDRGGDAATSEGLTVAGELWAMMLDTKATFDAVVGRLAPDEGARARRSSRTPSTASSRRRWPARNELSAVAKLYELHDEHEFDVIVLDTPPSRNALDFLEAPGRLLGFLEGRALQVFLAPGGLTARLFGRGTALVFAIFARVTGVDMLSELSTLLPLAGRHPRRLRRTHARRPAAAALRGDGLPDRHLTRAGAGSRGALPRRAAGRGSGLPEPR